MGRSARWVVGILSAGLVASAVVAAPAQAASSDVSWGMAKVVRWVDGDTVKTTRGTIRLVGVDTPEQGVCGYKAAKKLANRRAPVGSKIRLGNPASVDNKDKYDRKLRYVVRNRDGVDVGRKQIKAGSKARYDGRDGYQWHPRQPNYRKIDKNNADYSCGSGSNEWEEKANTPVSDSNPDLDCGDIPDAYKPIKITGEDYHNLDADGDGWGCEV